MRSRDNWYFAKGDQRFGPMSLGDLQSRIATGEVTKDDLVWGEGDPDWRPAGEVAELSLGEAAGAAPPPPPRPRASDTAPWPAPETGRRRRERGHGSHRHQQVPNYLWQSIVVTFLCCLPLGVVAIVHAAKVDGLVMNERYQAAQQASNSAKNWCIASALVALFGYFIALVAGVFGN